MAGLRLAAVVLVLAVACGREARVPVEIDLTTIGLTLADGRPQPIEVDTSGGYRRLVGPPGRSLDLYVRVPHDARLHFTLDPRTAEAAFAVSVKAGAVEHALRPRRVGEGDWDAALDGVDEGAIVRLRLENRGTTSLAWWGLRMTGTARPGAPVLAGGLRPPPGPLNVILLVSDALRADHLSLYGYWRATTPELMRLAAERGVVFEQAYAAGPSTPNSIPSLFTSRYPSALGIALNAVPGGTDRTLAEAFSLASVRTAAFVANPLLHPKLGYARGFGAYEILESDRGPHQFARADLLVDRALEYLSVNRDAPCFVYLHVMDTHTPFDPPPSHRGRYAGTGLPRPTTPRRAPAPTALPAEPRRPGPWLPATLDEDRLDPDHYDEAIAFVDEQIARLMRELDRLGVRDRTVLVVTADHGEALGAEDDGTHLHGHSLYEELAHVPLVALVPWLGTGVRVPEIVSLVDVAPTLVDLAGLPIPASFAGTSLFAAARPLEPPAALLERLNAPWLTTTFIGPGSVVEWAMREGPWKLLLEDARARLFDLTVDPKETTDVSAEHPEVAGYLTGRAARLSPALGGRGNRAAAVPAGELERPLTEALKALGYLAE